MNTEQELTCERAYRRGKGRYQMRTEGGRLLMSGDTIESVEPYAHPNRANCVRYIWHRYIDFGNVVWIPKAYEK